MITAARVQAAENCHWYSKDGTPQYEVKAKDGHIRKTTLADARKNSWLPSVTQVLSVLAKPGLEAWKTEQAVLSVLSAPRLDGEQLDAFVHRVLQQEKEHEQEASAAADLGSRVHAAIADRLMNGVPLPEDDTAKIAGAAVDWYQGEYSGPPDWVERIVVSDEGYAGKADLCVTKEGWNVLIDWKTAKTLPKENGWPEHGLQLGAYANATGLEDVFPINVYLSTSEPGKIHVAPWSNWREQYQAFMACLKLWQHLKDYRPNESIDAKLDKAGL